MNLHTLLNTTPQRAGKNWIIDGVIYTKEEGALMSQMSDAEKLQTHLFKAVFNGRIAAS